MISIADRFVMAVGSADLASLGEHVSRIFLIPMGVEIAPLQLAHVLHAKGTLDSDLVALGSGTFCHAVGETSSDVVGYRLVGEFDPAYVFPTEQDKLSSLVQKATEILADEETPEDPSADVRETETEPAPEDLIEDLVSPPTTFSAVPSTFLFDEIEIGIVFLSVDLNTFYRDATSIACKLSTQYDFLEDNELDVRQEKIDDLKKSVETLAGYLQRVDGLLLQNEASSKQKQKTLEGLLTRVANVVAKSDGNAAFDSEPNDVLSLRLQIEHSADEEHVVSLRLKDTLHRSLELCRLLVTQAISEMKGLETAIEATPHPAQETTDEAVLP